MAIVTNLLASLLVLTLVVNGQRTQDQYLRIWWGSSSSPACDGNPNAVHGDSTNLTVPDGISTVYIKYNGLWGLERCNDATPFCETRSINSGVGSGCTLYPTGKGTNRLHSIRFGDATQTQQTITLYERVSFQSYQSSPLEVTSSGWTAEDGAIPLSFNSFFFTGNNSWTAIDSAGDSHCLRQHENVKEYGITYSATAKLYNVVRIKMGCAEEDETTTTTTTTTANPNSGYRMDGFAIITYLFVFLVGKYVIY